MALSPSAFEQLSMGIVTTTSIYIMILHTPPPPPPPLAVPVVSHLLAVTYFSYGCLFFFFFLNDIVNMMNKSAWFQAHIGTIWVIWYVIFFVSCVFVVCNTNTHVHTDITHAHAATNTHTFQNFTKYFQNLWTVCLDIKQTSISTIHYAFRKRQGTKLLQ